MTIAVPGCRTRSVCATFRPTRAELFSPGREPGPAGMSQAGHVRAITAGMQTARKTALRRVMGVRISISQFKKDVSKLRGFHCNDDSWNTEAVAGVFLSL